MRCRTTLSERARQRKQLILFDSSSTVQASLSADVLAQLLSALAKSSSDLVASQAKSMMDAQEKSNEAMLEHLFTKFAGIYPTLQLVIL